MHNIIKKKIKSLKKQGKYGAMYMNTVVKIIACVVIGALLIGALAFTLNTSMNTASGKVKSLFAQEYNYAGGSGSGGSNGAVIPGGGDSDSDDVTLTLDGISETVEKGSTYTLPNNDSVNFVGYMGSNNKLYSSGAVISANSNLALSTVELDFNMQTTGYKVREKISTYGIRYYTELDTDLIESLREAGATVTIGTLIGPADIIGTNDLTLDLDSSKYINVVFESTEWYTEDSFSGMVGSIANIKDANANRDFVGRGYVTVKYDDGNGNVIDKTYYAEYAGGDIANNTANIAELSYQLKADTESYNALDTTIKEKVDYYANLYVAS